MECATAGEKELPAMNRRPGTLPPPSGGPLRKLAALLLGAVLVVLGVMFSVVLLAILLTVGLAVWAYLWWKSRELRRAMAQRPPAMDQGHVVEGEAVVVMDDEVAAGPGARTLPGSDGRH
jgi:membrane protein implicated in regulation of membrane protease activity